MVQAALDTVIDGAELTGVVTRMMLYHGAQIDLGTEYDGCGCLMLSMRSWCALPVPAPQQLQPTAGTLPLFFCHGSSSKTVRRNVSPNAP